MTRYYLHESLIFDDETLQINPVSPPDTPRKLSATASRCLLLFIQRQGEVIDKETLIHECWGKYGVMVTEGSMWKSISQLRQIFQNLGIPFDVIVTVPRLGYTFTSEMQVRELLPGELKSHPDGVLHNRTMEMSLLTPSENETPEVAWQEDSQPSSQAAEQLNSPVTHAVQRDTPPEHRQHPSQHHRKWRVLWVTGITLNLVAAGLVWQHITQKKAWGVFNSTQQYRQVATIGETKVFLQNALDDKKHYAQNAQARFFQQPTTTTTGKAPAYLYINRVASDHLSSYFLCDLPLYEEKNDCSAYFILTGQGDV